MYIGVDIGGTHFSVGLVDNEYNIIDKKYCKIESEYTATQVITLLIDNIKQLMENNEVEGIGIGVPGICNLDTKEIIVDNKHVWKNLNIIEEIQKQISIPIFLDNDANCAAIAEHEIGCLKNVDNCMLVTVGTGIGAGIILNGKIYRGDSYTAGELGHICVEKNGKECFCGANGCFEQYGSMLSLRNMLEEKQIDNVEDAFKRKDKIVIEIINKWLEYLADGLANVVNVLDISIVAIGGGASEYFEYFGNRLTNMINQRSFNKNRNITIKKAELLNDAGIIGTAILCKEKK